MIQSTFDSDLSMVSGSIEMPAKVLGVATAATACMTSIDF